MGGGEGVRYNPRFPLSILFPIYIYLSMQNLVFSLWVVQNTSTKYKYKYKYCPPPPPPLHLTRKTP